jgi:hypothetical protein
MSPTYASAPPPPSSWDNVPCDIAQASARGDCEAEHARIGIGPTETRESATQAAVAAYVDSLPDGEQAIEAARRAVDRMLAATLKDPMSAMQYRISAAFSCREVLPVESAVKTPDGCICYQVNARNSFGGYTGAELALAQLLTAGDSYVAVSVPRDSMRLQAVAYCAKANMSSRDATFIHRAVQ